MDPFNVITALATTATAVFGYRKMLDQKPIFEAVVKDIPESDKRNRPAREKLQQEGYYILRLSLISAPPKLGHSRSQNFRRVDTL